MIPRLSFLLNRVCHRAGSVKRSNTSSFEQTSCEIQADKPLDKPQGRPLPPDPLSGSLQITPPGSCKSPRQAACGSPRRSARQSDRRKQTCGLQEVNRADLHSRTGKTKNGENENRGKRKEPPEKPLAGLSEDSQGNSLSDAAVYSCCTRSLSSSNRRGILGKALSQRTARLTGQLTDPLSPLSATPPRRRRNEVLQVSHCPSHLPGTDPAASARLPLTAPRLLRALHASCPRPFHETRSSQIYLKRSRKAVTSVKGHPDGWTG